MSMGKTETLDEMRSRHLAELGQLCHELGQRVQELHKQNQQLLVYIRDKCE